MTAPAGNLLTVTDQRRRRHHLVSAFYLRGFANSNGRLYRTPLNGQSPHPIAVTDATVVNDYYSVDLEDGPSDFFERLFGEIEGPAATALRRLVSAASEFPTLKERAAFATWVALQHLRSDAIRQQGTEMQSAMIRLIIGGSGKAALRSHIETHEKTTISDARLDAEWNDITKAGGPTIRADPADHIRTIMELLPGTSEMLQASPWYVMRSRKQSFATADHPVVLIRDTEAEQWRGIGLATAAGFGVTLSRTHALIIGSQKAGSGDPDLMLDAGKLEALEFNYSVVGNARKAIYHHPSDRPAEWFGGLPTERSREMSPVGDNWINEEGIGSRLSPMPIPDYDDPNEDRGVGLSDVEWPIPGRQFDWTE